ncbi:MAG TPA: type 1 glutamine amidotransferase [Actinomycetes bacterium]|nr:type 1 glutamine amidotransferase [Actinomycetes bacterium]
MSVLVAQSDDAVPIGALAPQLQEHGIDLVVWRASREPPPASLSGHAALVVLGGAANPDQDSRFPWLEQERRLLREALDRGLPVLGSCLGAQLLAQVLGGEVGPLDPPEIGWVAVQAHHAASDDPLYRTLPPRLHAFQWHAYGFAPPPGSVLLATSPAAPQAFRFGDHAWGLQFHLEATAEIIQRWIATYPDQLRTTGIDPARLSRETSQRAALQQRHAFALGRAFAAVIHRATSRRRSRLA